MSAIQLASVKPKYKLSEALGKIADRKLSGTLICVNAQNLQGRIFVKAGNVLMARCRNHEGREALEVIQKHPLTLLKFHSNKNLVSLEVERGGSTNASGNVKSQKTTESQKPPADTLSTVSLQDEPKLMVPITADLRDILVDELTEQIGPLAEVLVSEIPEDISLVDAIGTLSDDIGDRDLSQAFVDGVKARV